VLLHFLIFDSVNVPRQKAGHSISGKLCTQITITTVPIVHGKKGIVGFSSAKAFRDTVGVLVRLVGIIWIVSFLTEESVSKSQSTADNLSGFFATVDFSKRLFFASWLLGRLDSTRSGSSSLIAVVLFYRLATAHDDVELHQTKKTFFEIDEGRILPTTRRFQLAKKMIAVAVVTISVHSNQWQYETFEALKAEEQLSSEFIICCSRCHPRNDLRDLPYEGRTGNRLRRRTNDEPDRSSQSEWLPPKHTNHHQLHTHKHSTDSKSVVKRTYFTPFKRNGTPVPIAV
jgi:hypothetical protein